MSSRTRNLSFSGSRGGHALELTDSEGKKLARLDQEISRLQQQRILTFRLDQEISRLQQQRILTLRKSARKKGMAALKLENLKSKCGKPFVEEEGHGSYKRAIAKDETKSRWHHYEFAYLCASRWEGRFGGKDTCGWVRGEPREERYDEIGPLCGSAGIRFYCVICGKIVGELRERVSLI